MLVPCEPSAPGGPLTPALSPLEREIVCLSAAASAPCIDKESITLAAVPTCAQAGSCY